jgi:hypothetical protein
LSLRVADLGSPIPAVDRQIDTNVLGAGLPGLDAALDPRTMGAALSPVMAPEMGARAEVSVASVELIDLKLAKRALIAYELESPDGPLLILGKHFVAPAQARRVYEVLAALHGITNVTSSRWGVPRPLGWLPEHSLVLYVPVGGRFLDDDLENNGTRWMPLAAECLADLHSIQMGLDRSLDLAREAASVTAWAEVVASTHADLGGPARGLTAELIGLSDVIDFESGVLIHKDVHYRHMVVGEKLVLLDVDELRLGDSSFDVAHFCAHLHLLALRRGTSAKGLEHSFLDAYARHRAWTPDERFCFFFAYTCLKLAWLLCLGEGVPPRPSGAERHRQTAALLSLGASRLESLGGATTTLETAT